MFVEVAFPLPLLKTFYYRCPATCFEQLQPGQRLLVPFQNRKLTAYVVRPLKHLPAHLPTSISLKEILRPIDASTLISPELFQLSSWISEYYFASQGEVLKACLPRKTDLRTKKVVTLTTAGLDFYERIESLPVSHILERQVLRLLAQHRSLDFKELGKLLDLQVNDRTLRKLVAEGWVEIRQDLIDKVMSHRQQNVVSLHSQVAESPSLAGLTPLQVSVIEHLRRSQCPLRLQDLLESTSASISTVRSLSKKGLILIAREPLRRDPFTAIHGFTIDARRTHTEEQSAVLRELRQAQQTHSFVPALLHGVTGSGKTEIYLSLIEETLEQQKSALILMPEIGLTPRAAQGFRERLGSRVAILHSRLSDGERFDEWWRIKGGEAHVVVGTRSAVFAPLENLGLIVVDEEHDPSYKQQESPRYHARDTALVRGKLAKALVVLGSATPAVETFFNARSGKYRYLRLASRVLSRPLPEVTLVDMREEFKAARNSTLFSRTLRTGIQERLERQEQVLILLNRRGFSACLLCRSCGQTIQCRQCSIALTFHRTINRLLCHYCDYQQKVPNICPRCSSEYLYFQGEGTEKVEALLEKAFPAARIARLDRDTTQRKNAHVEILRQFQKGETDILTGTQMISKGHDFHNVTLVGILSADNSLGFPDFRCAERTFHLLTQMSGRAGRGELPGQVLIQTFHPEHYCLRFVAQHNYEGFYEKEIRFRKTMHYPPFSGMANILARDRNLEVAAKSLNNFGKILQRLADGQMRILGPTASPLAKLKNQHRFQLLVKSKSRLKLRETLRQVLNQGEAEGLDTNRIHIDIDPVNIL
jgi:primosomal protein N' (replication factor Y) (superfamily II helicase)